MRRASPASDPSALQAKISTSELSNDTTSLILMPPHSVSRRSALEGPLTGGAYSSGVSWVTVNSYDDLISATLIQSKLPAIADDCCVPEILLCEGYITKIRGIGRTRIRFFRLTTKTFTFFSEEAVR